MHAMIETGSRAIAQRSQAVAPAASPTPAAPPTDTVETGRHEGRIRKTVRWSDEMSRPYPSTEGNFEGPAWFQAGFQSAVEGFYLGGLAGSAGALTASMAGVFVGHKTHSQLLGVTTGAAVGAGIMAGIASFTGPAGTATAAITGGLLGGFVTFRGNRFSRVRDSAGNAAMLAGPFMHGPAKVAAGLGAATAQRLTSNPRAQMAIGAAVGAGIGAALGAVGFTPLGIVGSAVVSGIAGGIGPRFGPRFSQFFRNISMKFGDYVDKGAQKVGLIKEPMGRKSKNVIGCLPSSFIKEGTRGAILADLSVSAFILGGIAEAVQQIDIFWNQKNADEDDPGTPTAAAAPAAPQAPPALAVDEAKKAA